VYDAVARAEMAPEAAGVGFESVEGAGSCVHLDASAAFLESVDQFLAARDPPPKA
jgi:proline iminopeptidase